MKGSKCKSTLRRTFGSRLRGARESLIGDSGDDVVECFSVSHSCFKSSAVLVDAMLQGNEEDKTQMHRSTLYYSSVIRTYSRIALT